MKAAGYGRIINVASLQSTLAFPDSMPYAAAKSGVLGLTRARTPCPNDKLLKNLASLLLPPATAALA